VRGVHPEHLTDLRHHGGEHRVGRGLTRDQRRHAPQRGLLVRDSSKLGVQLGVVERDGELAGDQLDRVEPSGGERATDQAVLQNQHRP
jgi:hypothetical protein